MVNLPDAERRAAPSGERLVVVGGLGLGGASLVPWYRAEDFTAGVERMNGWQDPDAVLSQVATVLAVGLAIGVAIATRRPDRPTVGSLSWGTWLTVASAAVGALVMLKLALNPDRSTVGVYLGLAAAVTQLYGAYVTRLDQQIGRSPEGTPPPPGGRAATSPATGVEQPSPPSGPHPAGRAEGPGPAGAPVRTSGDGTVRPPGDQVAAQPLDAGTWPETAYVLSAWLQAGADVEPVAAAYKRAFENDPARVGRAIGELRSLLDPGRSQAELDALLAVYAPRWAGYDGRDVLARLARGLADRQGHGP